MVPQCLARPCGTTRTQSGGVEPFVRLFSTADNTGYGAPPAQVVDGLKTLLTANGGGSGTSYLSQAESYTTALAFVQALGRSQDSHGDTNSVRRPLPSHTLCLRCGALLVGRRCMRAEDRSPAPACKLPRSPSWCMRKDVGKSRAPQRVHPKIMGAPTRVCAMAGQVAKSFVDGLEGAAQSCIDSLPSIKGASSSSVVTTELNKCCPVISQVREGPAVRGACELGAPTHYLQEHWQRPPGRLQDCARL